GRAAGGAPGSAPAGAARRTPAGGTGAGGPARRYPRGTAPAGGRPPPAGPAAAPRRAAGRPRPGPSSTSPPRRCPPGAPLAPARRRGERLGEQRVDAVGAAVPRVARDDGLRGRFALVAPGRRLGERLLAHRDEGGAAVGDADDAAVELDDVGDRRADHRLLPGQ